MQRLGLEPGAATEQAEVILDKTQELFEELSKHRDFQSRIRGIDRDAEQFAADVGDLARRVAPDLDGQPAESQARELARRLREARAVQAQHAALSQQRDGEAAPASRGREPARHRDRAARIALPRGGRRLARRPGRSGSAARPSGAGSRMTSATAKTSSSP